jgi:succinate-semialdehyde dehydrogenase/glutarate-semialdehyde dehydrogenase
MPYGKRAGYLKKAGKWLAIHGNEVIRTIHRDTGKLPIEALAGELLPAVMALDYYQKKGKRFLAPHRIRGGSPLMFNKKSYMSYKPYGVVGIISPWNYPFAIPFSEVIMALLAGNAVVLKTASLTLNVGRLLVEMFRAAKLPEGLFNYVELPGTVAGPVFIGSPGTAIRVAVPGVDKLFFTGSTAVGRELMALAAPRLLPLVLELGGADAAIVLEDADLDRAAVGLVWAAFSNAGQSCAGVQRIIVRREVYAAFLENFCSRVKSLINGIDLGPMISLEQKQAVRRQIEICLARGAKIAAKSSGAFFQDTKLYAPALVLTDVKPDMPVIKEEIFGPVVAVISAADDAEALAIANNSSYGLSASVWSRNHRRSKTLAARINAGAVMINDHLMSHGLAETPWGGFGDSGLGKTHGYAGFMEMVKAQVLVDDTLPGVKRNLFWHPYSDKVYRGLQAIIKFISGPGRLAALPRMQGIFFRYWKK